MRICDLIKHQDTYQGELGHTVLEIVRAMVERNIGAVPILHNSKLVGIFSERDLMRRVVAEGRDPRRSCKPNELPVQLPTKFELVINPELQIDRPHIPADNHRQR